MDCWGRRQAIDAVEKDNGRLGVIGGRRAFGHMKRFSTLAAKGQKSLRIKPSLTSARLFHQGQGPVWERVKP